MKKSQKVMSVNLPFIGKIIVGKQTSNKSKAKEQDETL
jgi:hypothetical protein